MTELIDDLDAAATLAAAEAVVLARRVAELEDLQLVLHWADLHAWDPRATRAGVRDWRGDDRLIEVGGDGSPWVQELCLPELAIARGVHALSLRSAMADALDLRHRLPRVWALVEDLQAEAWVARKVATMSRRLDRFQVAVVDAAVSAAIGGEAPSRVLAIAEAKIIEADRVAHEARVQAELRRRFVGLSRVDELGMQTVIARIEAGEAHWIDTLLDQVADVLAARPDLTADLPEGAGRDELRAVAFGWLSRPDELAALLSGETEGTAADKTKRRRSAVLYVHLHQVAVAGIDGVGRVEGLGPQLVEQIRRTLGHSAVTVRPVLDLSSTTSVNAYEFPESVKERVHLRTPGETFPHASRISRLVDLDHPTAWERGGPPGQTGDQNVGPLSRSHHRAKTHRGYRVTQIGLDRYLWSTPHGLHRLVGPTGTHRLTSAEAAALHP
ncbi:conserved hypothetical protein [metagenome]|uniref:DUF222 domain-containing protein n=1 Tax=metagenome TaxID=256318 RepID=A0A2P2CBR6_9ZZZZ